MVHLRMERRRSRSSTAGPLAVGRGRFACPAELRALSKLNANWRAVVEGAAYDREIEDRSRGQAELALEGNDR